MIDSFDKILRMIENGEKISQYELIPYLSLESKELRLKVNISLAMAYYQAGSEISLPLAKVCILRAWYLSDFAEELLPFLEKIHSALNDTDGIKKAYKRVGIRMADEGRIEDAIKYFSLWQNAYGNFDHLDKYEFDFDILASMKKIAEPYVLPALKNGDSASGRKLKLSYIIKGITEINSVLIKINLLYGKYHDKNGFEVGFFTLNSEDQVMNSPQGKAHVDYLKNTGNKIFFTDNTESIVKKVTDLGRSIHNFQADLIITSTALVDFEHYFLTLILSNNKILSFNQGPPPQFTPPSVTWSIAWTKHPLIDAPVGGSLVPLEFELFNPDEIIKCDRNNFDIPQESTIIVSAGRTQKFQDVFFWKVINDLLTKNRKLYFIGIGIEEFYAPNHYKNMSVEIKQRIKFAGWQGDYLSILKMADLVVDTYPNGGGVVIVDAMVFGIPVISFNNNYMIEFDQTNWSPAEEIVDIPDLIIQREDYDSFIDKIDQLLQDQEYRLSLGQKCREKVLSARSNPLRMVQSSEKIYRDVINDKLKIKDKIDASQISLNFTLGEIKNKLIFSENYKAWQIAFENGYNSNMGDHSNYFYNKYLELIGFYNSISNAERITEYGSGDGMFMRKYIKVNPNKKFYLCEISEKAVGNLKKSLRMFNNIEILLNYPEVEHLENIDLAFSFLLCQSMPKVVWAHHLSSVRKTLSNNGSYIFQFAYHVNGASDNSVTNAISGSNKYSPDEMFRMLENAGFQGCDISDPINLDSFNTDVLWYFCRAY